MGESFFLDLNILDEGFKGGNEEFVGSETLNEFYLGLFTSFKDGIETEEVEETFLYPEISLIFGLFALDGESFVFFEDVESFGEERRVVEVEDVVSCIYEFSTED